MDPRGEWYHRLTICCPYERMAAYLVEFCHTFEVMYKAVSNILLIILSPKEIIWHGLYFGILYILTLNCLLHTECQLSRTNAIYTILNAELFKPLSLSALIWWNDIMKIDFRIAYIFIKRGSIRIGTFSKKTASWGNGIWEKSVPLSISYTYECWYQEWWYTVDRVLLTYSSADCHSF